MQHIGNIGAILRAESIYEDSIKMAYQRYIEHKYKPIKLSKTTAVG